MGRSEKQTQTFATRRKGSRGFGKIGSSGDRVIGDGEIGKANPKPLQHGGKEAEERKEKEEGEDKSRLCRSQVSDPRQSAFIRGKFLLFQITR
jgi:hypothetical protein